MVDAIRRFRSLTVRDLVHFTESGRSIRGESQAQTRTPPQAKLLPRWYLLGVASRVQRHRLRLQQVQH